MIEAYFFWSGVAVNVVGLVAVLGLGLWWACEWWVAFRDISKPLMSFYASELKAKRNRVSG